MRPTTARISILSKSKQFFSLVENLEKIFCYYHIPKRFCRRPTLFLKSFQQTGPLREGGSVKVPRCTIGSHDFFSRKVGEDFYDCID